MAYNAFETRTMLTSLEEMFPAKTFLLDSFFRDVKVSTTKHVDIHTFKGKRRLAAFVQPLAEGKVVERLGFTAKSFTPPYIKNKMPFSGEDLLKIQFGEHIYAGGKTGAQMANEQLGKDLAELREMVVRREEWMAANALNTGIITMVGEGVDATVDFGMAATHKVTLLTPNLWSESTSDPINDFRDWSEDLIAKDSGLTANVAIHGRDAIKTFIDHAKVRSLLDNRRMNHGSTEPKNLPSGAKWWGNIEGIDHFSYNAWYTDPSSGNDLPLVPVDKVFLGSTQARTARCYGAIIDLESSASVPFFPKSWITKDPSVLWVMLQSAPLVAPFQIDAFVSATVL